MKYLRFASIALAIGLAMAGCSTLQKIGDLAGVVTSAKVPASSIIVAANAFDAVEVTATNYLRLPRCMTPNTPLICRSPAATKQIIPAVRTGRVARNNAEQFLRDHPGELGASGLYDALVTATNTLAAIYSQYGVSQK